MVTTLLLNPVALLVARACSTGRGATPSGFTDSDRLGSGYALPELWADSRAHWAC